jgi:outer membrane protein TolC
LAIIFSLFSYSDVSAQIEPAPVLTLEEAIAIELKNNFDIIIAKNEAEIATKNNLLITTGFVPTLSVNLHASVGRLTDTLTFPLFVSLPIKSLYEKIFINNPHITLIHRLRKCPIRLQ